MRLPAAAVALLSVAGCLGPPGPADPDPAAPGEGGDWLRMRDAVDLGSKARPGAVGTNCQDSAVDGDCGLGEPTLEVDGAGTIYLSGVCCLTVAPPVYVSRDGGATFTELATPGTVREQFGIEGDFAVDAAGRVYFADIEFAGTFQVTVWDAGGAYLRHTKWPAPPLVDRDWVRAEGDGTVYYVYNTGSATNVYKSVDAAATWSPTFIHQAAFGLGNAVSGPRPGELWLVGGSDGGDRVADFTADGGLTWRQETTTLPAGGSFPAGAFDEGGRLYLAGEADDRIALAVRGPNGEWGAPANVSGPGHHRMPWVAAGAAGGVAVAWYGTDDLEVGPATEWHLRLAVSLDAGRTWTTRIADPVPVLTGDLQRQLLDFFQAEVGPDGTVHVGYSRLPVGEGTEEQLTYVRSDPVPALARTVYPAGP